MAQPDLPTHRIDAHEPPEVEGAVQGVRRRLLPCEARRGYYCCRGDEQREDERPGGREPFLEPPRFSWLDCNAEEKDLRSRTGIRLTASAVDLAPVTDSHDEDIERVMLDAVDDPVIPLPDAVERW